MESLIQESEVESASVALHDLETGRSLLINPDAIYHPASTMKVPVMMEVFQQADKGRFRLDDQIQVKNCFSSIADGSSFSIVREDDADSTLHDRIGQSQSVRELIRRMIVRSSNLATNLLVELVKPDSVNAHMKRIRAGGMVILRGVEDNKAYKQGLNNSATARSLMVIMRRIAEGKAVSRKASEEMMQILAAQEFNEGIPAGLPKGIRVAHKTGWIAGIYHDAAIVFPPNRKPYILVAMTRGFKDVDHAHRLVASLSRAIWDGFIRDAKP